MFFLYLRGEQVIHVEIYRRFRWKFTKRILKISLPQLLSLSLSVWIYIRACIGVVEQLAVPRIEESEPSSISSLISSLIPYIPDVHIFLGKV